MSVAIGELADGLVVDLDKVPKKYAGLDGTELAISESQERMAIVVDPKDVDTMLGYAEEENLEAVVVAKVTEEPRLILKWRGKDIVNISRAFLNTMVLIRRHRSRLKFQARLTITLIQLRSLRMSRRHGSIHCQI